MSNVELLCLLINGKPIATYTHRMNTVRKSRIVNVGYKENASKEM